MWIIIISILIYSSLQGSALDVEGQLLLAPYPQKVSFNSENPSNAISFTKKITFTSNCGFDTICSDFLNNNFNHSITFPLNQQEGLDNFRVSLHERIDVSKVTPKIKTKIKSITIELTSDNKTPNLKIGIDESYTLKITEKEIIINAPNVYGARHAFETLIQLVKTLDTSTFYIPQIPIDIQDFPRFKWRGLLVDPSRNPIKPVIFYKMVDSLALLKANVLHIHLSDCQTFVFESKKFPELTKKGMFEQEYVLTHDFIKELVKYGKTRGVIIYGEIDLPGHTASWGLGYPGVIANCWDYIAKKKMNYGENIIVLNPVNKKTWEIIEGLIEELNEVFDSDYIHVGGDEVWNSAWENSKEYEDIKTYMKEKGIKDLTELAKTFNNFAVNKVISLNKTPIVYEEVYNNKPSQNTIIHIWSDLRAVKTVVSNGYKAVVSAGFYLDKQMPNCFAYDPNSCKNTHSMWVWTNRDMYAIDFMAGLAEKEKENVLGGEGCSWGESVDQQNFFERVFQRYTAIAERFWSDETMKNPSSHEVRANYVRCIALRRDIFHVGPLYHSYCQLPKEKKENKFILNEIQ